MIALLSMAFAADWATTLEQVVPAVVSLQVAVPRNFDTEGASSVQGTGFVVDAERGLLLTNRHLVHPGPVVAEAIFQNHEEVELEAVYRDPVHDFGFFRFDPDAVRHMDLVELELAPDAAKVGAEIRIVGNDAGEKLSILDSTLARLDRNAPTYGRGGYGDFNTFYLQAASNTSGGSSGSPVVDVEGRVVALNAGGATMAASAFYLPLDRIVRALDKVQAGEPVTRGTLQTRFRYEPYDELRRLGLSEEAEATARAAHGGTGLLVAAQVTPGGPADGLLEPGDVVLRIDGETVDGFVALEARLDEGVGETVTLDVERGGEALSLELTIGDLHAITPNRYLELGGGLVHELSYQKARHYGVPVEGLMLASSGYSFYTAGVPEDAVLDTLDGVELTTLDDLVDAVASLPEGARVPVRYHTLDDPAAVQTAVMRIDRTWFPLQLCVEAGADWPCEDVREEPVERPTPTRGTTPPPDGHRLSKVFGPSLVAVTFTVPYRTEGVPGASYLGAGLVIDEQRGLVLVDRDTVPVNLGDATLTFGGSVRVPGRVLWLHPSHNFAVVQYDPPLLGDTPVRAVTFRDTELEVGDQVWHVGLGRDQRVNVTKTKLRTVEAFTSGLADPPQFTDSNVEVVDVHEAAPSLGGVLSDRKGRVVAVWASFGSHDGGERMAWFQGLPSAVVLPTVEAFRAGTVPSFRSLGAELAPLGLAEARDRGLDEAWARKLEAHDERRRVLSVVRVAAEAPAEGVLQSGDLLLAVNGEPVTRMWPLEQAVQAEQVRLTLMRGQDLIELDLPTWPLVGEGIDHLVSWAGMLLHEPHHEVQTQRGIPAEGVYVTWYWYGSPAHRYAVRATRRIVEVNGQPTGDLATFLEVVGEMEDRDAVRLKTIGLDGRERVETLKLDLRYWPTWEAKRVDGEWVRTER